MNNKVKDLFSLYKKYGWDYTCNTICRKLRNGRSNDYGLWLKYGEKKVQEQSLQHNPMISVVVPVYNVKEEQLVDCIESVRAQTYSNWELCLVDDASTMESVREVLKRYEGQEKIKIVYRKENGHISRSTNDGIAVAEGEFIGFLDCDDFLTDNALYEMAYLLNERPELDFIYSDEDLVTEDGQTRFSPIFKPNWSPDTYLSHNYTNHFSVYRASIVKKIEGLRVGYEGSQDYDFVLRFTEHTSSDKIAHIDKVLYHWRVRPESVASGNDAKPYVFDAAKRATEDAIQRRNLQAVLEYEEFTRQYNVVYQVEEEPKVSIIIPLCNNGKWYEKTIQIIKTNTNYNNYEILMINCFGMDKKEAQDIAEKYHCKYIEFQENYHYAKMCNLGLQQCEGEYVIFLSDLVEVQSPDWIRRMVGHCRLDYIGAVGAKVIYPNRKYIHSFGVEFVGNRFSYVRNHYLNEKNLSVSLNSNFLSVSEHCYMIKKSIFTKYGLFDEEYKNRYAVYELCVRLFEHGLYQVSRPDIKVTLLKLDNLTEYRTEIDISSLRKFLKKYKNSLEKKYLHNKNYSAVIPLVFAKETRIYTHIPNKVRNCEWLEEPYYELKAAWGNGLLQLFGYLFSEKRKRTLLDQIWLKIRFEDGQEIYVQALKEYLGGFDSIEYDKIGAKWSGFFASIPCEQNRSKDIEVEIMVTSAFSQSAYGIHEKILIK